MATAARALASDPPDPGSDQELGAALQLLRANLLVMMRFQLAVTRGDQQRAMAAMDSLVAIDADIESLSASLRRAGPRWDDVDRYLREQKSAIAVEKHGLAGGIRRAEVVPALPGPSVDAVEDPEPTEPRPRPFCPCIIGAVLLVAAVIAASVWLYLA